MTRDVIQELRKCDGKRGFGSDSEAMNAADHLRRRFGGPRLRAYECAMCGQWHLTKRGAFAVRSQP